MISFFTWYYRQQTISLINNLRDLFELIADKFAIPAMLAHISEPLYQDYTYAGRIIGFFIRSGRIILGLIVEFIIIIFFGLLVLVWLVLPIVIVFKIFYILTHLKY